MPSYTSIEASNHANRGAIVLAGDAPVVYTSTPIAVSYIAPHAGTVRLRLRRTGTIPSTATGAYTLTLLIATVEAVSVDLTDTPDDTDWTVVLDLPAAETVAEGGLIELELEATEDDLLPAPVGGVEQGTIFWQLEIVS